MKAAHRNKGAVMLARTGKTQAAIAARIGCSRALVAYWLSGERKPTRKWRTALDRAYSVAGEWWDRLPEKTAVATTGPAKQAIVAEMTSPVDLSPRALARELASDVISLRAQVRDSDCTPLERAKVYRACTENLKLLGTITGDSLEISEARILRLPALARVQEAITSVLSKWPDALQAVGEELQRLGKET